MLRVRRLLLLFGSEDPTWQVASLHSFEDASLHRKHNHSKGGCSNPNTYNEDPTNAL